MKRSDLVLPYGGTLVDLAGPAQQREELVRKASSLPSIQLSPRSLSDLELLATGALSPLDRFMGKADYERVMAEMRLADGTLFPMPVTLPAADAAQFGGREIALRDAKNELVAILRVEELFEWDPAREAEMVYGTTDRRHPVVAEMSSWGRFLLSGPLTVLNLPKHYDFPGLRRTPAAIRSELERFGSKQIVALQATNAIHRAEEEFLARVVDEVGGALLLNPAAGMTKPGDIGYYTRVRAWKALCDTYGERLRMVLNLLPLATRFGGPREALWHAIIQRNFGAKHLVIGREYADPGRESRGEPFHGEGDARELVERHAGETGVWALPAAEMEYLPEEGRFQTAGRAGSSGIALSLSDHEYSGRLSSGREVPEWFTRPEVADVFGQACPPRRHQGFCVWFTGLPSAGKSTIAEILAVMLLEHGRQVTVLDGDVVRTHLSKGLGFSKEDRDANILRIGFVAAEIARHHGAVICAAVSPYEVTREQVRKMVDPTRFVLVHVATPIEVCEQRDVKRMYARARAGEIKGFTGVDDPYEPPQSPDLVLRTTDCTAEEAATRIINHLIEKGFLASAHISPRLADE